MRRVILLAGLALGLAVPASGLPAVGGSDLPFEGSQSGLGTFNLATGELHIVTTGPASHFGLTKIEQNNKVVFTSPTTLTYTGTWTATAANGDTMVGTSIGTSTFLDPTHSIGGGTYTSTGGTGRFAGSSLTFTATVRTTRLSLVGTVATSIFEGEATGQLSH